ncbi:MAG: 5-formyltetrahydrofolate cyclo-ligase [Micavibrio aeruginosavorus]|uniref:5-formyltetrahydrofolate cyclo-ligase n=1 Tax=Micavibrio aeruginosavorus TaxID=349221 RepID=A0A7T5R0U9_9BACT|nr:MAG: 5-formyltetrahydrofolate cyclo-ligase [Micavibrio aeruginosavorus]
MSSKQTLREEAIRFRNSIDPFSEDVDLVVSEFFECLCPQAGQVVALYWPKGKEFDTGPLIEALLRNRVSCALPVMQKDSKELRFVRWDESIPLIAGPFGIMQPEINRDSVWVEPDIVVVPMLAFDRQGHRLGYGGGYYDATLAALRARKPVQAVAIGYSTQAVLFNLPSEPHDQKMDWVITPNRVQRHT